MSHTDPFFSTDFITVPRFAPRLFYSRVGIQVCDQAGRVNCILAPPGIVVSNLAFGGENFDTLFATCGDKVYKHKLKVKGAQPWSTPHKPAPPRL